MMVMAYFFIRGFVKWVCSVCENTWICMTLSFSNIFYTESMLRYFLSLLCLSKMFSIKNSKAWQVSTPQAGVCPPHTTSSNRRRPLGSSKDGQESPTGQSACSLVSLGCRQEKGSHLLLSPPPSMSTTFHITQESSEITMKGQMSCGLIPSSS